MKTDIQIPNQESRGAIHIVALMVIGLLVTIVLFLMYLRGHQETLERTIAEQSKQINDLDTKVKIIQLKVGL